MARRSNSDNAIMGIVYLIGLPFILIFGLIGLFGKIITFFNKPKLNKNIGTTTANCPYCGVELSKFPLRKTKCKHCGQYIYVRTRPADGKRILIKENEIETIGEEYHRKYGTPELLIDVSEESNKTTEYLVTNYKKFCNYPHILKIGEENRLEILKYMWENNDCRLSKKHFTQKFPKYDAKLLYQIFLIEDGRFNSYIKKELFIEQGATKSLIRVDEPFGFSTGRYCLWKDMIKVSDYYIHEWTNDDEYEVESIITPNFLAIPGGIFKEELSKPIYIWQDDKFVKMEGQEIIRFCRDNGIECPFEISK